MSNHDNDPCAGCPAPHSSAPSAAPCPPGCPSDDAADTAAIAAHVAAGHTDHCAKRLVWGDGECECGKKGPARFDATGRPWRCVNCGELSRGGALTHTPGCPVALAEKIVKEAGDGR